SLPRRENGRGGCVEVANLSLERGRSRKGRSGWIAHAGDPGGAVEKRLLPVHGDRAGGSVDGADIDPGARRDAETAALSDGEGMDALVRADLPALAVAQLPRARGGETLGEPLLQELEVGLPLDEADVLALALVRRRQAQRARLLAHLGLRAVAQREERSAEGLLGEPPEDVGLVLGLVRRPLEGRPALRVGAAPRVVSGRDEIAIELARAAHQLPELEPVVALHAGIGSAAREVFPDEVLDHVRLEVLLEIQHVMREAHAAGDRAA